jgi:hypothetical protein
LGITLAQYAAHSDAPPLGVDDTELGMVLEQAEELCASCAGWPEADDGTLSFVASTRTIRLDGPPGSDRLVLRLPVSRVVSVTSLHYDTEWAFGAGALLVEGTDFESDGKGRLYAMPGGSCPSGFSESARSYKAVVVAGYTNEAYPSRLIPAIAAQARHMWSLRNGTGVSSSSMGGQSMAKTEVTAVPPHVMGLLHAAGVVVGVSRVR